MLDRVSSLSAQEREVLEALTCDLHLAEVADALRLSDSTVATHVRTIYRKLGVRTRAGAIAAYWTHRLLQDSDEKFIDFDDTGNAS